MDENPGDTLTPGEIKPFISNGPWVTLSRPAATCSQADERQAARILAVGDRHVQERAVR